MRTKQVISFFIIINVIISIIISTIFCCCYFYCNKDGNSRHHRTTGRSPLHLSHPCMFPCTVPQPTLPCISQRATNGLRLDYPRGPCTQIVYTSAPIHPNSNFFKAKVYTSWAHGPLGLFSETPAGREARLLGSRGAVGSSLLQNREKVLKQTLLRWFGPHETFSARTLRVFRRVNRLLEAIG